MGRQNCIVIQGPATPTLSVTRAQASSASMMAENWSAVKESSILAGSKPPAICQACSPIAPIEVALERSGVQASCMTETGYDDV